MKARIVDLKSLFGSQTAYQIPQFQRPYAWNENDQWMPLWEDVRTVAERILEGGGFGARPHFMGAIVLQLRESGAGEVTKRLVVDGQQRLTTLQLLLKAAEWAFQAVNDGDRANRLRELTQNGESHWGDDRDNRTKIRQANRLDKEAFYGAMFDMNMGTSSVLIARAYTFFKGRVESWLESERGSRTERSDALEETLSRKLQIAAIDLDLDEKPHIIFETLNARGEPLTQSDLVKNTVMYEADVIDDADAARGLWGMFEDLWWRKPTGESVVSRTQLDRFLHYWMVMKTRQLLAFPGLRRSSGSTLGRKTCRV